MNHKKQRILSPHMAISIAVLLFTLVSTPNSSVAQSSKRVEVKGFKPVTDTEKRKRWGIIIGINAYDDPNINSLRYASADAKAIYEVLTHPQTGGFKKEQLHLLTSDSNTPPTRNNILESLALLNRRIRAGDTVVFHFSGHGLTQDGINYLLPADTRVNIPIETAIPLSKIYAAIQNAQRQIIFLDACHSGQRRDKGATSGAMSSTFAEAVFSEAEGRVTLASCDINESSFEDDKLGHGVFTYYLLEALRGKADTLVDKRVTASEANRYVVEKVRAWAFANRKQQTPRISSNVSGEIVLTTATLSVPEVPPPPPEAPGPWAEDVTLTVNKLYDLGHGGLTAAFSPNGKYLATNHEGKPTIWSMSNGDKLWETNDEPHVKAVSFSPDGKYFATAGAIRVTLWETETIKEVWKRKTGYGTASVSFSPDGKYLATANHSQVIFRDVNSGNKRQEINGGYGAAITFSPDGKYLAIGGASKVTLWETSSGEKREVKHKNFFYNVRSVSFSPPDGKYLATGDNRKNVTLWETSSGKKIWDIEHGDSVNAVTFSPNGQYLAAGGYDKTITFYRIPANITLNNQITKETTILTSDEVPDLAWSLDGKHISDGKKVYRTLLQR